ncbi:MAG: glucose-6-phosphate isomerase [Sphingomicrobium sp.]
MTATNDPAGLPPLTGLFDADPGRVERFTLDVAGLHFDWSKTHLTADLADSFAERLAAAGFASARAALFAGGIVNASEGRAATHVAERSSGSGAEVEAATARRTRMRALADAVEAGVFGDITAILHIGIGGSLLGPALVVGALGRRGRAFTTRFLANIDGAAFDDAIAGLDPATTLIVAVSKTFTTLETRANLESAMRWLAEAGVEDPYGRVIAVTAAAEAAIEAGIDETRILSFGEGIGGRYSLWSAVGFTAALALGVNAFGELLEGANLMDAHFLAAEPALNACLIAAFADRYYVERAGAQSRAIFAYDERLSLLAPYLQQLEMESNGKSVTASGSPVAGPTAPVTWGGVGTDAQHAVFQLLHQGTVMVPVEFVVTGDGDDEQDPERHAILMLNAFAQAAALMTGAASDDPQRAHPGNRPSATILIERLYPRSLGALLAFYEHRTFANAVLMGINPFDQFGVEYSKALSRDMADGEFGALDPSTRSLIAKAGL